MAADDSNISDIQKQEFEDSTSCCICTDIYKCPKLLPCGHTFCLNCIEETGINTNKRPEDGMPCPMCRREFKIPSDGFTGLQNNYYVEGLIRVAQILGQSSSCDACLEENQEEAGKEVQRAEMYCCDCKQKLCEECCRHHRKLKLTKNHELLSISGQLPADKDLMPNMIPIICELHKQEDLKIYCNACKTVVCSICFIENHEGHKGIHITKAVDDFRKEIANNIEKVETCMSQAEIKKLQITKSKKDVHEKFVSLEYDIIRRRDRLRQVVDKQANELLEELSFTRQSKMKEVQIETDNIDAQLARLESYNSYCRKIMSKGSACDICRSLCDISVRVSELQEENQSLTERQLTPLSLCFIETEFEEKEERNFIGQLTGCLKVNKNDRLNVQITSAPIHKEPTRTVQWSPATAAISQARISVCTILNQSHDSLLLSVSNTLTVEVKHGDLTNMINTDVVVSCINKQLDMDGPLSYQIMRVAGPGVQTELLSHKHRLLSIHTGSLVHTSAGNIKGVKAIIHVVRPNALEFLVKDEKLMIALRTVFANCLSYTNDVLKLTSIGLPTVGFGIFGAQMVVDSFLDAVEAFATTVNHENPEATAQHRPHHLNYIQLVSNEYNCINKLIPHIKYRLGAH